MGALDGRKIPYEMENPFDNVLIGFSSLINPYLRQLGVTPNLLTTFSLGFGILAAWLLFQNHVILAIIAYIISYLFDCMDGNMARMFDMVTRFGDLYDHGSDIIKTTLFYIALINNGYFSLSFKIAFLVISFVFGALTLVHIGCQERNYDSIDNEEKRNVLSDFVWLCSDKEKIQISKYFGFGTYYFVNCMLLLIGTGFH